MKTNWIIGLLLASAIGLAAPAQPSHAGSATARPGTARPDTTTPPTDSVYQLRLQLTDQHGRSWDWRTRRGRPQLVAMFYTSCQYICPLIVEGGKTVDRALTPQQRSRLGVMLISIDPAHDTPRALAQVVRERRVDDRRWALASPPPGAVRSVAAVLDTRYRALADGQFNHTSALVLLDADGRIVARTDNLGSRVDPAFIAAVRQIL